MGLDLRLLPFDRDSGALSFSHTVLSCGRDYALFDAIKALPALPVPKGFTSFAGDRGNGETGYGETVETPYGDPVLATTAALLVSVDQWFTERNIAIHAYLKALPPNTRVALYWH